jgi:ferric-dicitrate binding protein FerR (iron transport regulator)
MMRDIDDIWVSFLEGEALDDEALLIIDRWIRHSPDRETLVKEIQHLLEERGALKGRLEIEEAFRRVERAVRAARRKILVWRLGTAAASVLLLVGLSTLLWTPREEIREKPARVETLSTIRPGETAAELLLPGGEARWLTPGTIIRAEGAREIKTTDHTLVYAGEERKGTTSEYHELRVPSGGEYDLLLSDGTLVHLNAASTLRYPDRFAGEREVFLTGEAYFEVASDAGRPFVVHAGGTRTHVLGTSFNVNAYPDREVVMTTLVEGRVRVECGEREYEIRPGTQVIYHRETGEATTRDVDVEMYTSWKDGYYIFEGMPLEELMNTFARWYNLRVAYESEGVKKIAFSGNLRRYDDVVPLLKKLEYTRDVEFIVEGNLVKIKKK